MKWWLVRIAVAVTAAIVLVGLVPPTDLLRTVADSETSWLVFAALLLIAGTVLGAFSFRSMLAARGVAARFGAVFAADLAGHFYALTVPGGVAIGGAVRLFRLTGPRASMSSVLSTIIASRLLDIVCGSFVAIAAFPFIARYFEAAGLWILLLGGIYSGALFAYAMACSRRLRLSLVFAFMRSNRVSGYLRRRVRAGVLRLGRMRQLDPPIELPTIVCVLARHLIGGAAVVALLWAVHADISYAAALWARAVTGLAMLLPLSIAGVGIREAGLILLLAPFGVSSTSALAISLMLLSYQLLLAGIGGLIELGAGFASLRATNATRGSTGFDPP